RIGLAHVRKAGYRRVAALTHAAACMPSLSRLERAALPLGRRLGRTAHETPDRPSLGEHRARFASRPVFLCGPTRPAASLHILCIAAIRGSSRRPKLTVAEKRGGR